MDTTGDQERSWSRAVIAAFATLALSSGCPSGDHDCVLQTGYCTITEICDSLSRHCEQKCNAHPPRACPEGTACDYGTGACRAVCSNQGSTTETNCENGLDDDCDGRGDCEDPDCDGARCGTGCLCSSGLQREVFCSDALDNDENGLIDCADPNCVGLVCRPPVDACDLAERCDGTNVDCQANLRKQDGAACGTNCSCLAGVRRETGCDDRMDNDGDGLVDCEDLADCPSGTACQRVDTMAGLCELGGTCN